MATVKQLAESSNPRVTFSKNMSPEQMVDAWSRVSSTIRAQVPEIDAAMTALENALDTLDAAARAYQQASDLAEQARKAAVVASLPSGSTVAVPQAAQEAAKSAQQAAANAIGSAYNSVKDQILNTEVPGT